MQKPGKSTPKRDQFPQSARLRGGRQRQPANSVIARKGQPVRVAAKTGVKTGANASAKAGTETGRGRIPPGIGENPDKTSVFPRISKTTRGHYDSGTATES